MESIDFSAKVQADLEKARKNIKKPNILVAGGTGAGKSSLINMLLSGNLAPVGAAVRSLKKWSVTRMIL